jgi:hypothetical protein
MSERRGDAGGGMKYLENKVSRRKLYRQRFSWSAGAEKAVLT